MLNQKSGFCSIIGPPNAGKSTFLNQVLGENLSITSKKKQTTRNNIHGIFTDETQSIQIIYIDTPGIIDKPHHLLDKKLNQSFKDSLITDIILFLCPMNQPLETFHPILTQIKQQSIPLLILFSKVDIFSENLNQIDQAKKYTDSHFIFSINLLKKEQIADFLNHLIPLIPEHPFYYPTDILSNRQIRFFIQEKIRLSLLNNLSQEVPHQSFVEIQEIKEKSKICHIHAIIYVEKDSQKSIVIGKKGTMLSKIGKEARIELENYLEKKVMLHLLIKVKNKWRNNHKIIQDLDSS